MCNSTAKTQRHGAVVLMDGRPVLQPASNRVLTLQEAGRPLKKAPLQKPLTAAASALLLPIPPANENAACADAGQVAAAGPASSSTSSPTTSRRQASVQRETSSGAHPNGLKYCGGEKPGRSPEPAMKRAPVERRKPKKCGHASVFALPCPPKAAAPGSIAAAQREQATLLQAQRKLRIAHYGRVPGKVVPISSPPSGGAAGGIHGENRCCLITSSSDPVYVAYHDQEWGVAVHDDRMLFELLALAGAQVGMDWTTILKKRIEFRAAFAGFEAEVVAGFSQKKMASISSQCGIDLGRVRSVVNNANCILEVRKELGSLDAYIWGFVNRRPILTQYSSCRRIPAKTSKSEAISKDMLRRGFRFVGPTVIHFFMQAAGLTVDHLLSCSRRHLLHCTATGGGGDDCLPEVTSPAVTATV